MRPDERLIADLWADLLGTEVSRPDDDFFDLGGSSLTAVATAVALRENTGAELAVSAVFEHPTVAALAAHLRASARPRRLVVGRASERCRYPLTVNQRRRLERDVRRAALGLPAVAFNVGTALRLRGPLDVDRLRHAVRRLLSDHPVLRSRMDGGDSWALIGPLPAPDDCVELVGAGSPPPAAGDFAARDRAAPFDLRRGPLLRCSVARLGERDHAVSLTVDHLVADGWSLGLLLDALRRHYNEPDAPGSVGSPAALSFVDYAWAETRWLRSPGAADMLAFWQGRLAGAAMLPVSDFLSARPVAEHSEAEARTQTLDGPDIPSAELAREAAGRGSDLNALTLTAAMAAVARADGRGDVAVVAPFANRVHPGLDRAVGWFSNLLAVRLPMTPRTTWDGAHRAVRSAVVGAYDHADLPFWYHMDETFGDRARQLLASSWLFWEFHGAPAAGSPVAPPRWAGLTAEPVAVRPTWTALGLDLFAEAGDRIRFGARYRRDRYDDAAIAYLLGEMAGGLSRMVERPQSLVFNSVI